MHGNCTHFVRKLTHEEVIEIEHIEYLRILEKGYKMRGVIVDSAAESVDTPENLELVRELMKKDIIKRLYMK